jgi:glyceraldehyde-3-phosphate dehydrogenase (NADP+)
MSYDFPILINGEMRKTKDILEVKSPYDGHYVGKTYRANQEELEQATSASVTGFQKSKSMALYERAEKLEQVVGGILQNREEFAKIICEESGKPIKFSRLEVDRAINTFSDAVEECKRIRGEQMPLDFEPGSKGRWAIIKRFPIGPILGICPFNFPLNLVCHKVAPALASGNSIVLKPASQTPFSALRLAQEVQKAGFPEGILNVLPMDSKKAHILVKDERFKMLTFTGSPEVGWDLKTKAGHKAVTLELGGNAAVIIHSDADLEYAAARCVLGAYYYSGQNCISVQRIYLHDSIYDAFLSIFSEKVRALKSGDPADETTDIGPMIHHSEIERISKWIEEAVKDGATILTGGTYEGTIFSPTVITDVNPKSRISCREVFAPLVAISKYKDFKQALEEVNNSDYGLQAGVLTKDVNLIFEAYEQLEVGGVIAGDVPTYRVDQMPYGGVKKSGIGREGVRFAIEEMTERKLLVMNL